MEKKSRRGGIAIAGNIIVDCVNIIERYPQKNMLTNVLSRSLSIGGCVSNTIIDLAGIDQELPLYAYGKVGSDEHGRFAVSEIEKHGVDVSGIVVSETASTSFNNVMSERDTGDRTFFYLTGAGGEFCEDDIDVSALDCDIFHIGYILLLDMLDKADDEYGTHMARLLCEVQKQGIKTSVDVVSEDSERFAQKVIPALKYCDYAIMNEIECCGVTGLSPRKADGSVDVDHIRATMEKFLEYGVREKVIIHCPEGGFCLDRNGTFTSVPSLRLPEGYIKGTVGAGDAFAAASLYGLYHGFDAEKLLGFASASAACALSVLDTVSGIRSRAEIEDLEKKYPRREKI